MWPVDFIEEKTGRQRSRVRPELKKFIEDYTQAELQTISGGMAYGCVPEGHE